MAEVEVGEGDTLVQGQLLFRRDIKEKWQKVQARLVYFSNLHGLKLSDPKDSDKTIDTITITKDLVTVGPVPEKDKTLFHLANNRKQVHLSSKSNVVADWLNVIEIVAEIKRDPSKYVSEEFLRQKITAKLNQSENLTGGIAKIDQIAKNAAKNARGFNETDLLKKESVDSLEDKIDSIRDRVVFEILQTEQSYVRSLNILLHAFKLPMKKYMKEISLSEEDLQIIFGNLEEIIKVNTLFLENLFQCFREWNDQKTISDLLLQTVPTLNIYTQYSVSYNNSIATINKLKKKSEEFKTFVDSVAEDPACGGLDIVSFLIMPIQRIPRYVLLVFELLKNTNDKHPDFEGLQKVSEELKTLAENVNTAPQEQELQDNTVAVIQKFEKYKEHKLIMPGRKFVRQCEGKHGAKKRVFVLMTDVLICASERINGKYTICNKIFGPKVTIDDEPTQPNSIVVSKDKNGSFVLSIESPEEKKLWIENLKELQTTTPRNLNESGDMSYDDASDDVGSSDQVVKASSRDSLFETRQKITHRLSLNGRVTKKYKHLLLDSGDSSLKALLESEKTLDVYLNDLKASGTDIALYKNAKDELIRLKEVYVKNKTENGVFQVQDQSKILLLHNSLKNSLTLKSRTVGQQKFSETFLGEELVSWLKTNKKMSEVDAIKLGDELLSLRLIKLCNLDTSLPFCKFFCYQFLKKESLASSPKNKDKLGEALKRTGSTPIRKSSPGGPISQKHHLKVNQAASAPSSPKLQHAFISTKPKSEAEIPPILDSSVKSRSAQEIETIPPKIKIETEKSAPNITEVPSGNDDEINKPSSDPDIPKDPEYLKKIIADMSSPDSNLINRKQILKKFKNSMVGSEIVDWMLSSQLVSSREDGVKIGEKLIENKLMEHVSQEHKFRDGHFFYKIVESPQ